MQATAVSYQYYETVFEYVHGMSHRMTALVVKRKGKNVAILTKDGQAQIYHGNFNMRQKGNKVLGKVEIEDGLIEQIEAAAIVQKQLTEKIEKYIGEVK